MRCSVNWIVWSWNHWNEKFWSNVSNYPVDILLVYVLLYVICITIQNHWRVYLEGGGGGLGLCDWNSPLVSNKTIKRECWPFSGLQRPISDLKRIQDPLVYIDSRSTIFHLGIIANHLHRLMPLSLCVSLPLTKSMSIHSLRIHLLCFTRMVTPFS